MLFGNCCRRLVSVGLLAHMAPLLPFKQAAERGIVGRGYMRKIWRTLAGLLDLDILDCLPASAAGGRTTPALSAGND